MNKRTVKAYSFFDLSFKESKTDKRYITYCCLYFPMFLNNQNLCKPSDKKFCISLSHFYVKMFDMYLSLGLKWHHKQAKIKRYESKFVNEYLSLICGMYFPINLVGMYTYEILKNPFIYDETAKRYILETKKLFHK